MGDVNLSLHDYSWDYSCSSVLIQRSDSQEEFLIPDRIEVSKYGLGPALGLPHLHSDIRVTGACLVLGLQALSTHNWVQKTQNNSQCQACHSPPQNQQTSLAFYSLVFTFCLPVPKAIDIMLLFSFIRHES